MSDIKDDELKVGDNFTLAIELMEKNNICTDGMMHNIQTVLNIEYDKDTGCKVGYKRLEDDSFANINTIWCKKINWNIFGHKSCPLRGEDVYLKFTNGPLIWYEIGHWEDSEGMSARYGKFWYQAWLVNNGNGAYSGQPDTWARIPS